MRREDINIRDPFVLVHDGKYYLYGTRSDTCWGKANGFDCYVGTSLDEFDEPVEVFHRPDGFFADQNYWAPECYEKDGWFYFVVTFGADDRKKGTYILRADRPEGPFELYSGRITPEEWTCIDGTLYWDDEDIPWLVFSHTFEDGNLEGNFCAMQLSSDLKEAVTEPVTIFSAADALWAKPFPYAREEFGADGDCYFSDGPYLMKMEDGKLVTILSSWSVNGYAVGTAVSDSGKVLGPWKVHPEALYPENGGHGMFFRDFEGNLIFTLHYPNDKYAERPIFWGISYENGNLRLTDQL